MLTEYIVIAFVAVGLVAIAVRFLPRDEYGARRLPRVIDDSIGMAAIRSVRRRRPRRKAAATAAAAATAGPEALAEPSAEEIAYRIGAAEAPAPTIPTRLVVSKAALQAHPPAIPGLPAIPTTSVHGPLPQRRLQAHPASSLGLQRRIAAAVAAFAVAIAVLGFVFIPRGNEGGVLSATGLPSTPDPNVVASPSSEAPSSTPTPSASHVLASPSTPGSTSAPAPTPAASTPTPPPTRRPTPTPARTTKPTPKPPTPAPTPTPPPLRTPTPPPSAPPPTPSAPPPTPSAPPPTPTPTPTPTAAPTPTP